MPNRKDKSGGDRRSGLSPTGVHPPEEGGIAGRFDRILEELVAACKSHYADRLVSLAVYGSVGRGTPRPDSDIDLLLVAEDLPDGRVKRADEFRVIERSLERAEDASPDPGPPVFLSPVIKTIREVRCGSPLFLDMTEDARILFDRDGFLEDFLSGFRERLVRLGSKRIWVGSAWYWDLKPDYVPGEVFEL